MSAKEMGGHEEISSWSPGPFLSDDSFWHSAIEQDGDFRCDRQLLSSQSHSRVQFEPTKKPPHVVFDDVSALPMYSTCDHFAFNDTGMVGRTDCFGQNFSSDTPSESLADSWRHSRNPIFGKRCSFPMYSLQDSDFESRVTTIREPSSTNSSRNTNMMVGADFGFQSGMERLHVMSSQMPLFSFSSATSPFPELKPHESIIFNGYSKDVKVECGNFPKMLDLPPHTLPQMKPPILPNLCSRGTNLLLSRTQFLDGSFGDALGSLLGRTLSDPKNQESFPLKQAKSAPALTSATKNTSSDNISCTTNLSTVSKCLKKPYIGKLTPEERRQKIMRYRQKRNQRKFDRGVTYQCRKTLADRRPRVRGRFARNNDIHAKFPKSITPPQEASESSQRETTDYFRAS